MRPTDTTPEAEAVRLAIYSRMSPGQRLSLAVRASLLGRDLAFAGIRRDHPDWSEADVRKEFLRRQFPPDRIPLPLQ